ncbi:Mitochondrial-processing peptidase subunit alpha [Tilletia horrida]|uniref:Alpha-MPP n=1 Tax=Tilletia horrida TaxID=155126 RepID=A0AAN6JM12_9BASI|nr:Mitochondrial-processing peptidase subunit alpha [Tilletia horrida]KAK0536437.1 Mitochondrial-processing peptidase subunit alpha [Tilletia horrida]
MRSGQVLRLGNAHGLRGASASPASSSASIAASSRTTTAAGAALCHRLQPSALSSLSGPAAARLLSAAAGAASGPTAAAAAAFRQPLRRSAQPPSAQLARVLQQAAAHARSFASTTPAAASATAPIPSAALIEISKLPNQVTVATEATPGHFSALGVYVDVGSRYERQHVPGESGVSHLLDRMAFKSTSNRSAENMTTEISRLGGNFFCSSSRETLMYQASIFNQDLSAALEILADTVLNPSLSDEELEIQKEAAAYEISEISAKPELMLPEVLHHIAYANNTLGNALLCPPESLPVMTAQNLRDFVQAWYTPDRIVVAGAGMAHQELVEVASQYFGKLQARNTFPDGSPHLSAVDSSLAAGQFSPESLAAHARAPARYTGGESYISSPELDFTHIYVAFEGLSVHDEDIYALATLQILLGGGGSFSAGGPGKGMYSRLYSNVLNKFHQVDFCAAFHHCYNDSGLFGIAASVHHNFVGRIPDIIARELETLMEPRHRDAVTQSELSRARNQLKSSLVMALESRLVEVEDLGRQVQVHGKKVSVEEMCDKIDQVDLVKLRRVAARVLRPTITAESRGSGLPTVVAQGAVQGLGDVRAMLSARGLGAAGPSPPAAPASLSTGGGTKKNGLFRRAFLGGGGSGSVASARGLHTSARTGAASTPGSGGGRQHEELPEFFRPKTRAERAQLRSSPSSSSSSSSNEGPSPSRHALFYRDIVPPLLRVLAYGSIVYFGLHLVWVVLDREEQDARHAGEVGLLQAEIRGLKEDVEARRTGRVGDREGKAADSKPGSWWSGWWGR